MLAVKTEWNWNKHYSHCTGQKRHKLTESHHNCLTKKNFVHTLLLRHITGQREHPKVQQQHTQPQKSHLTLTGNVFFNTLLIRATVAWYSSGATRDCKPEGNSLLNRLLRPKLEWKYLLFIYCSQSLNWFKHTSLQQFEYN